MANNHPKWNFKEFSAFLLIYAAYADQVVTKEEEEAILKKIDPASYERIKSEFKAIESDEEIIKIIMSYKGLYFPTVSRKNELMDMVKNEFLADGKYSQVEKALFIALDRLL